MFDKILVAHDGSEGAARALSAAIKLGKIHDATSESQKRAIPPKAAPIPIQK